MCDIIPGVSGGTIALITGIYERLVLAIGSISADPLTALLRGRKAEATEAFGRIDRVFLRVLVAGAGLGLLAMSGVILSLMLTFPAENFAFFFGLIIASSLIISYRIEKADAVIAVAWVGLGWPRATVSAELTRLRSATPFRCSSSPGSSPCVP
ncbi:MAG TPA: DUF368 domain-containing protein [Methanoregulaceae archaeon]|nr:DUF368 domain-containing protein [Methanoregulaceae archaeon]HPD10337.1 DUF368 domain-containing protein [Methanoregulaceae archaeon]HRT15433.1 DUF368 domain-containing protein [Methanoregulaceae archaeon]HRU30906.1 DUF368 domain-containing protein [Methanoregulaceae archaeon]